MKRIRKQSMPVESELPTQETHNKYPRMGVADERA